MKRGTYVIIAVAVIVIILAGALAYYFFVASSSTKSGTPIKVAVISGGSIEDVPVYVGIEQGYWLKLGLNVTTLPLTGGVPNSQSLVQFTSDSILSAFLDYYHPPQVVILGTAIQGSDMVLVGPTNSNVTSLSDLKGMSIGITKFGSLTDVMGRLLAKQANLVVGKNLTLVPLGGLSAQVAALSRNQIKAFIWTAEAGYMLQEQGLGKVLFPLSQVISGPWVETGITAMPTYIKDNPKIVSNFVKGYYEAVQFMQSNPDQAGRDAALFTAVPAPAWTSAIKAVSFSSNGAIGQSQLAGIQNFGQMLVQLNVIPSVPPLSNITNTQYVPSS
ncbi:MAG: ABC transporter substrate-binding protein [Thaumarchaeota archaeon]|nr:ABC transporter substrate-binding protein [Nitrososphaerota archaeon]